MCQVCNTLELESQRKTLPALGESHILWGGSETNTDISLQDLQVNRGVRAGTLAALRELVEAIREGLWCEVTMK